VHLQHNLCDLLLRFRLVNFKFQLNWRVLHGDVARQVADNLARALIRIKSALKLSSCLLGHAWFDGWLFSSNQNHLMALLQDSSLWHTELGLGKSNKFDFKPVFDGEPAQVLAAV
jgi:hypothetical protein